MPWKEATNWVELFQLALAFAGAISGGAGGALVASTYVLRRRLDTLALGLAHVVVGMGIGFGVVSLAPILPGVQIHGVAEALQYGFMFGVLGSVSLAASHVILTFSARKLGIERATIEIRMHGSDGKQDWKNEREDDTK